MKFASLPLSLLLCLLCSVLPALAKPIPVILDTDIGTDIDDTWALAQILRSPELDLKLVLTDSGDTRYRAALAAKFLEVCGRSDIPVGIGHYAGPMNENVMNQLPWLKEYSLGHYTGKVHEDGIGAMISLIMASEEPVTLIAIGCVPNLRIALEREPRIAAKCRFIGMHGSFRLGYDGKPGAVAEANVVGDPESLRKTLSAPWREIILTPLDTCGLVSIQGDDYHALWCSTKDPMLNAVLENYCHFAGRVTWMNCDWFTQRSTTLFDCVAVTLAHDQSLLELEELRFDITPDGFTRLSPEGRLRAKVATSWKDKAAYEHGLSRRLLGR